jgi:hypothetical protein
VSEVPPGAITLVSFDIDGTLEIGDPPGLITIAMVEHARRRGYLIGSASDRPLSYQRAMWERLGIVPHFTALKHRLAEVRARFAAHAYYHVGDTDVDEHFAATAGFAFLRVDAHASWGPSVFGDR